MKSVMLARRDPDGTISLLGIPAGEARVLFLCLDLRARDFEHRASLQAQEARSRKALAERYQRTRNIRLAGEAEHAAAALRAAALEIRALADVLRPFVEEIELSDPSQDMET